MQKRKEVDSDTLYELYVIKQEPVKQIAEKLGLSISTLYKLIREHEIYPRVACRFGKPLSRRDKSLKPQPRPPEKPQKPKPKPQPQPQPQPRPPEKPPKPKQQPQLPEKLPQPQPFEKSRKSRSGPSRVGIVSLPCKDCKYAFVSGGKNNLICVNKNRDDGITVVRDLGYCKWYKNWRDE